MHCSNSCRAVRCLIVQEIKRHIHIPRNKSTYCTDEHTVAHKGSHFTTRVHREPLVHDELELVSLWNAVVVNAYLEDRVGTEIIRDKVRRLEKKVHVGRERAPQWGRGGQEPGRVLRSNNVQFGEHCTVLFYNNSNPSIQFWKSVLLRGAGVFVITDLVKIVILQSTLWRSGGLFSMKTHLQTLLGQRYHLPRDTI